MSQMSFWASWYKLTAIFDALHRRQDRSFRISLAFALVSPDKGRVLLASFWEEVLEGGSLAASVKRTLGTKVCSQVVWILREGESLEFLLLLGFEGWFAFAKNSWTTCCVSFVFSRTTSTRRIGESFFLLLLRFETFVLNCEPGRGLISAGVSRRFCVRGLQALPVIFSSCFMSWLAMP
jgi:hypothetical protein